MFADAIRALLPSLLAPLIAMALGAARMLGIVMILPVFSRMGLTGLVRGAVAMALALPLLPALQPMVASAPPALGAGLMLMLAKEALIGMLIGTVFSVPFWAAEAAGEIIDLQRGSQSAVVADVSGLNETGITGTLITLTAIAVFFAVGGMRFLVDAVYQSYAVFPPLQFLPHFSAAVPLQALGVLDKLLAGGFVLASPLLVAMILAELSLALMGRFAPQLHVFDLALSVKGIVHVVGLPIYAVFLITYLRDGLAPLAAVTQELRLFAG
jgi:type III secretion protein T